jgi:hypothetical protein
MTLIRQFLTGRPVLNGARGQAVRRQRMTYPVFYLSAEFHQVAIRL